MDATTLDSLIYAGIVLLPWINGIGVVIGTQWAYLQKRNPIKWLIISLIVPFAFFFLFFSKKEGDFFNDGKNIKIKKAFIFLGHLFVLIILVVDCIEILNILKNESISDLMSLQFFFGIICGFYIGFNDKNLDDDHFGVGYFFILLSVAIIFPPSIIFYMLPLKIQQKLLYLKPSYINDMPVDKLLNEYHKMFTEFCYAETQKCLKNNQNPNSNIIAKNSYERTGGYLIAKYHLSPKELNEVVKLYVKKY
jgi:hypothetical protein